MRYKKILLSILFLILFFSFGTQAKALTSEWVIGVCDYVNVDTKKNSDRFRMMVYMNSKSEKYIKYDGKDWKAKITDKGLENVLLNEMKCYNYIGVTPTSGWGPWQSGGNRIMFDNSDYNKSDYENVYKLVSRDLDCGYDIGLRLSDGQTYYARYRVTKVKGKSYFNHYILNPNGDELNVGSSGLTSGGNPETKTVYGFKATTSRYDEDGKEVKKYDLTNYKTFKMTTASDIFALYYKSNMGYGFCPDELKYYNNDNGNLVMFEIFNGELLGTESAPLTKYWDKDDGTTVTQQQDVNTGNTYVPSRDYKYCRYNLETTIDHKNASGETLQYNIIIQLLMRFGQGTIEGTTEKKFCVIAGDSKCTDFSKSGMITDNFNVDGKTFYAAYAIKSGRTPGLSKKYDDLNEYFSNATYDSLVCPASEEVFVYRRDTNSFEFTNQKEINGQTNQQTTPEDPDNPTQTGVPEDIPQNHGGSNPDYTDGETVEGCAILGNKFLSYLRSVLFWMQIFVPILALVLSMVDLVKAIAAEDEDAKKKAVKATKTRIICSVIILLLPYIIEVILLLADRSEGHACVQAFMNSKGN